MDKKIGADDPEIARAVEERYADEALRQMLGDPPKHDASPTATAVREVAKLTFLILFVIACIGLIAKVAWLLIQSLFGV